MKNFNIRPYFDDYDENKQFYQILFRPSYAIQARELNQLQTILQEQIARHGQNIFKEGSMVVPGQLSIDTSLDYVKLDSTYAGLTVDTYLSSFSGQDIEVIGSTSGIKAKVIVSKASTDSTSTTLWVKYISSGNSTTSGTVKTFLPGEIIYTNASVPVYASVKNSTDAIGLGSSANIQKGVYFVNGRFVLVQEQTIILDAYTNTPTYRVGLQITEDFISPEEDSSLYDNAQGSTNYAAPGAHRYYIDLTLTKYGITNTTDKSFIELLRVNSGLLESVVTQTAYSLIEDSIARRTYDESGNYVVKDFQYHVKEHRSNDRGNWVANTNYLVGDIVSYGGVYYRVETTGNSGLTAPNHTIGSATNGGIVLTVETNPFFNQGVYTVDNGGDATSMAVQVEPGKGYVYGYEIEKIGTTTVKVPKATTFKGVRNATIQTDIGSYIKIKNIFGSLDVTSFPTVSLRDSFVSTGGNAPGNQIGTARVRYIEYDSGTIGLNTCQYVLSLYNIKMNPGYDFQRNVFAISFANSGIVNFTCDIVKNTYALTGTIANVTNSNIITGVGTKFTTELNVGDCILHYASPGVYDTPIFVASIQSDTQFTSTVNVTKNDNLVYYKTLPNLIEGSNDSLIFKLPTTYTRKVKDLDDESITNISYYVRKFYTATSFSNQITINTASTSETFASPQQPDAYHVVNATTGAVVAATISLTNPTTATIVLGTTTDGNVINVIATTKKTLKERTKTIVRGYSEDFTTSATAITTTVTLGKVDGIRLLKVYEFVDSGGTPIAFNSPIPSTAVPIDITSRYTFDSGCKDAYYDFAFIKNTTSILPRSPIRVIYDYHEHSTIGDYFTIDSYQKTIEENYTLKGTNETVNLFDCIDFRPTKTGTNSFSATNIPAMGFDIIADYTYYLPRVDKISLSSKGDFVLTSGVPAEVPSAPSDPENSMLLYTSTIYPSIVDKPIVVVSRQDNRRYTMRDIGALDSRLSNVEYYTSLSLLESQTNNLQLFDNQGNVSFKNGFIVDNLSDQSIGDTTSSEYRCSVDISKGELHPSFYKTNLKVFEKAASNADRLSSGYVLQNNVVTLPYTTTPFAYQPYASTMENVTPYIKLDFVGDLKLNPSSDEWFDTSYRPDVVLNLEGNFDALVNQYKSQLGTVWNDWQTTWAGNPRRFGDGLGNFGINQEVRQTRTGTNTYVKPVYQSTLIGDRIVSVDIIPFIRPRTISFYGSGFKPTTRVYSFFDQTNVDAYVTPARKITLTSKTGIFDTNTQSGASSDLTARSIASKNDAVSVGLSMGDIIHNGASGNLSLATATAIVKIDEDDGVRVINLRGTFTPGQTVYGTISGATGVVYSVETNPSLVTNIYGEIAGTFDIPSNSNIRFRTGTRNFTLSDSLTNGNDYTTFATTSYVATGYMDNRERTIVSSRNGVLAQEKVSQDRSTTVIVQPVQYYVDPLAQSFVTPSGINGLFVDSVDVFFAGKDRSIPVFFEIREMSNGLPTRNVLPGSRVVLKPSDITVSTNASVYTRIKTQFPIYLDGDTEYCFVLGSDSPYYQVWVSELGQDDVLTGQRIAKQPYLGSLFKSQNASTWTPDQLKDIKFNINRCVFSTSPANIHFSNQKLDSVALDPKSIFTKSGSSLVRVNLPNHGIPVGSNVVISGLTTSINGIPAASINGTKTVTYSGLDHFVFDSGTNATVTAYSNFTDTVYATPNIKFDLMNLITTQIEFPGTSIQHFARSIDPTYSMAVSATQLLANENTALNQTWMIASSVNESNFNNSAKSLDLVAQLTTTDDYLSPVLDLDRYSLVLVGNRIDVNSTNKNVTGLDDYTSSLSLTFSSTYGTITSGTTGVFSSMRVGNVVSITGATNSANNGFATITAIDSTNTIITVSKALVTEPTTGTPPTCTIVMYTRFVDEISENGTAFAKYPMKTLNLNQPATDLRIFMDVNVFSPATVDVYYRTASNGQKTSGLNWILATPTVPVTYASDTTTFNPLEYHIFGLAPFTSAQIKVVMKSSDTTKTPIIKNIRLISTS